MNTTKKSLFILVDDDMINNAVSRLTISNVAPSAEVVIFTDPRVALDFLADFASHSTTPAILLLNLNMPFMTGWEFLDRFEKLGQQVRERIKIYMLTASIDDSDRIRAENNSCVSGYLSKPLSSEMISMLLER
jgi:CheY-like chemotaxis protein